MVIPADNVRYLHIVVIYDTGKVIRRRLVRFYQYLVFKILRLELNLSTD
jgi:hypothetical protein